jgi:hypothetical protein
MCSQYRSEHRQHIELSEAFSGIKNSLWWCQDTPRESEMAIVRNKAASQIQSCRREPPRQAMVEAGVGEGTLSVNSNDKNGSPLSVGGHKDRSWQGQNVEEIEPKIHT